MQQKLVRFLMMYRNTPHELFLNRRPCTHLDVMRPSSGEHVLLKQMDQKRFHDRHCQPCEFLVGQAVWVRNVRDGWLERVCAKTGPVSYEVNVDG